CGWCISHLQTIGCSRIFCLNLSLFVKQRYSSTGIVDFYWLLVCEMYYLECLSK
uniref:ULP_PROTEASE domain-containing protein n=1 Tax=Mesocestoides corti TaxID=53468 RepID=A0A5K3ET29_MESCO